MFAPVGTKTYVTPKTKYIIVHTTNKVVNCRLRELEKGKLRGDKRERTEARKELFAFNTGRSNVRVLNFNKFTLALVSRFLRKYPDEVMMFIGENYWFSELPEEIQEYGDYPGNTELLQRKMGEANEN